MSYTPTTWVTLDVITAAKANNWETQYAGVFDSSDKTATGAWTFSKATSAAPTLALSQPASYMLWGARGVIQPQGSDTGLLVAYNMVKRGANWKNIANAGVSYVNMLDASISWGCDASPGAAETTFTPTERMNLSTATLTLAVALSGTSGAFSTTLSSTGNFAVNTSKFTVTASNGNTLVAGTLSVTSDLAVNTNKFTVTASSGNTLVAGTLSVTSDFAVNTNKFTVTASSGQVVTAGSLGVGGTPTTTLQVFTSATNGFQFTESGTPGGYFGVFKVDANGLKINSGSGVRNLEFQIGGTTKLTIDTSGTATIANGLLVQGSHLSIATSSQAFQWTGSTELDAVRGDGTLRIQDAANTHGVTLRVTTDSRFEVRDRANSAYGDIYGLNFVGAGVVTVTQSSGSLVRSNFFNTNSGGIQTDIQIGRGTNTNDVYIGVNYGNAANAFIDNRSGGSFLFKATGATVVTIDTSGNLTAGRFLQLIDATNPFVRLTRGGVNWDLQVGSSTFEITNGSHGFTINTSTGAFSPTDDVILGATKQFYWSGRSVLNATFDGALKLSTQSGGAQVLLRFTTDRLLELRDSGDTGYADLTARDIDAQGGMIVGSGVYQCQGQGGETTTLSVPSLASLTFTGGILTGHG